MIDQFEIRQLRPDDDRTLFSCGSAALDRYLRQQVTQDMRRRVSACFVATHLTDSRIAGFYTLAAGGVPLADLSDDLARRLPRYPSVPVARLGRLAIDQAYQGRKLGAALLWDAVQRVLQAEIMAFAVMVDAKDATAAAFYQYHGFVALTNAPLQLVLPLAGLNR